MGRWNATCGVSLHTELLGRKLREMGHEVTIYAPTLESAEKDWCHRTLRLEDEPWVVRAFEETDEYRYPFGGSINSEKILGGEHDALIVQSYIRFPVKRFEEIAAKVRENCPLILVVHVGYIRQLDPLMGIDWDAIVVFDERYVEEMLAAYGADVVDKVVQIPYPCAVVEGVKAFRPGFAESRPLFFSFGRQRPHDYLDYLYALKLLAQRKDFAYWVVRSDGLLPVEERWLCQERGRPGLRTLYSYLKGSDIHLLPKGDIRAVVVSSTLAQTLYSGTPIIAPDTRHFERVPVDGEGFGVIVKYRLGDVKDLTGKILVLMEDEGLRKRISENAKRYALSRSDEVVAQRFLELINSLQ